jgi:hypothetical protein
VIDEISFAFPLAETAGGGLYVKARNPEVLDG